ncbi:MAG TPA: PIN domain-containing protein [Candidatus Limnocylindrales bacterium]|nr:PIN domain-containing protein [Candidatus Limnocylindrales bacterium]
MLKPCPAARKFSFPPLLPLNCGTASLRALDPPPTPSASKPSSPAGPVSILPFEDDDAPTAGRLRADLERAGTPIGAYDLLIAAQARNRRLTLITANVKEFRRVKDLSWEDWARP